MKNPLEEYPHLFCNGEFKIKYKDYLGETQIGVLDGLHLELMNGDCTLIARPIEDMTDEELIDSVLFDCLKDKAEPEYIKKEILRLNKACQISARLQNYLLSIGVYPFPQSHFGDTVIDTRTLKTNEV